jgi:rare lipoprotein A
MTRPGRPALLLFATLIGAALLPFTAHAQATTPPPVQSQVVQVDDGHFAVSARAGTMLRRTARFRGTTPPGAAGHELAVQRFDDKTQTWVVEATSTAAADGSFLARWRTNHIGAFRMRVVLQATGEASAAAASPELTVTVYKPAMATWYGPGLHGRKTACGQRLTPELLGVAHRRLPCGTPVALYYQGRTIVVPVVDRGPFRHGMTWDLTEATAQALGFTTTDRIGAVRLRQRAAPAA